jgi:PAS domain S-box-containing protein
MARATAVQLTGIERTFDQDQIIVSKTDLTGHLTYANELFLGIARYAEDEVLGQPHSLVRHPDMPRAIFDLLWETLKAGREIFAFVINRGKDGSHYWVLAHVTPTLVDGTCIGYHSNRRVPPPRALRTITAVYQTLLQEEARHSDKRSAVQAGKRKLQSILDQAGQTYDEYIWSLINAEEVPS